MKGEVDVRRSATLGKRMYQYRACYAMIVPFFLLFGIFIVLPIAIAVFFSFTDFNMLEWPSLVGLENYIRLVLEDDVFLVSVRYTLIFAVITGPVCYFACLLFAWLINELDPRVRAVMTFFFYAPSISGTLYVMWSYIFSGDMYGWLNYLLMKMNLITEPIQWLSDPDTMLGVIIFIQIWMSLGTSFLSFIAGFQGIDHGQYEAGALDGISGRLQELIYITLPNMKPQLLFGAVMQIGASFAAGAVGQALLNAAGATANGVSTQYAASTLITHMNDMASVRNEMGYACAIAVLLFLMMLGFNALVQKILRRVGGD